MACPNILVVTLFSGENEFDECIDSVRRQIGVVIVHEVIADLPKRLAHQRLFEMFNERRGDFDYLVKLDADMKFSRPDALLRLVKMMEDEVDLLSVSVWDGMTSDYMQSVNIFSNRCLFEPDANDPLFTDRVPITYPGRQVYRLDRQRLVHHAFNPSPYQAFMFGVHRAMKVMQHGASIPRIENAYYQLKILSKVADSYLAGKRESARLACVGAGMVMAGRISDPSLINRQDYREEFLEGGTDFVGSALRITLSVHPFMGIFRLWGIRRFAVAIISYINRKGFSRLLGGRS